VANAPIDRTIGEAVRACRFDVRLSLREVARRAKLSAAFVGDIELGRRKAKPDTVRRIARALGANEDYLLDAGVKSKVRALVKKLEPLGYEVRLQRRPSNR